ncbi:hypothetical protein IEO21_05012 [Rhodonia placenta]|uniref:SMP domain-containing protein n=1 Tax=Rhodonia placenta TaxID=104341 RepID=A0A8H7U2I2_9APHY|nr:hypothetical protein IEO21_05012 [Postia placenta]
MSSQSSSPAMSAPATPPSIITNEVTVVSGDFLRAAEPSIVSGATQRRGSVADAVGIDLDAIGKGEMLYVSQSVAGKLTNEQRKHEKSCPKSTEYWGSGHHTGNPTKLPDPVKLKELARQDAVRILAERKTNADPDSPTKANGNGIAKAAKISPPVGGVNLATISAAEARTLMSHEHRALGFRPPPGSLAAEAQAAAAKHPDGPGVSVDSDTLKDIALRDAERIKADRELNIVNEVNVSTLGKVGAERVAEAEEEALGRSPPPGSLADEAKRAANAHPEGGSFPVMDGDPERLEEAARRDAQRLEAETQGDIEKPVEIRVEDVAAVTNGVCEISIDGGEKQENPEKYAMKNGVGSVLRQSTMQRTETGDSVEIVGDVL